MVYASIHPKQYNLLTSKRKNPGSKQYKMRTLQDTFLSAIFASYCLPSPTTQPPSRTAQYRFTDSIIYKGLFFISL